MTVDVFDVKEPNGCIAILLALAVALVVVLVAGRGEHVRTSTR